jgi:phospholipid/cholesterol/gamma-HCH transport system substrate-binding protein
VKEDTVAVLRTQGLTGIGHVELSGGSRASPPLAAHAGEEYPVILTGPSLMVRMDAAVTTLLASLTRSSASFNALLDERNRAALRDMLASWSVLSKTMAARADALDAGLANASRAMENAARASAELPALVERIRASADAVDRMAVEVARAAVTTNAAVEGARAQGREIAGETLPEAQALLAELRELTATLRRVSGDIERNPAVLLQGRPSARPGPGE